MIGIEIFSGSGGMSLGARWAGIQVQIALELDKWAFKTYVRNHPGCFAVRGDLRYVADLAFTRPKGIPVVLFGGPPCQGFSTSNQKTRGSKNQQNWLFQDFIKLVTAIKPDWVVFENVRGIVDTANGEFIDSIEKELIALRYGVSSGILDAADFGVPQHRNRLFLIARKNRRAPALPLPQTLDHITVGEAIRDLPILRNGADKSQLPYRLEPHSTYARKMRGQRNHCANHLVSENDDYVLKRYKHIPQGGNWEDIPERLMRNYTDRTRCHTGIYRRLSWDEPSVVIGNFRKNMLIHPTQNRGLSVREAARLQSFPDWYQFEGPIGLQQQQVGNAVPPLLAKAVFDTIVAASES